MAKRINNYSRTESRKDFEKTDNVEDALDFLEQQGKLKPKVKLKQSFINERCVNYYDLVVGINSELKITDSPAKIEDLRQQKKDYQTRIINLCSIVIGSAIKRFKTLYPMHFQEVFTENVVEILQKIEKNKYNREKSSFHSYVFETCYQGCLKFLDAKAKYENSTVNLLQD